MLYIFFVSLFDLLVHFWFTIWYLKYKFSLYSGLAFNPFSVLPSLLSIQCRSSAWSLSQTSQIQLTEQSEFSMHMFLACSIFQKMKSFLCLHFTFVIKILLFWSEIHWTIVNCNFAPIFLKMVIEIYYNEFFLYMLSSGILQKLMTLLCPQPLFRFFIRLLSYYLFYILMGLMIYLSIKNSIFFIILWKCWQKSLRLNC